MSRLLWIYTGNLARAMDGATWIETTRELSAMGWQVELVDAGPAGLSEVRGVQVRHVPRPELYLVGQALFHARLMPLLFERGTPPEIVIFHQMSALWLLPARLLRLITGRRRPLLVLDLRTLHMPTEGRQTVRDRIRGTYYRFVERVGALLADGQLAITQRLADAARVPAGQLWGTWPSGVRPDGFEAARDGRRWPAPDEPVQLIYIGSLMHERNLDTLCLAVQAANTRGLRFELTLVGDGTARSELESLAAESGGTVRLLGQVPHEDVPAVLADAHVGVLPFPDEVKFRVSSPIKLFEYLASGMPVLATSIACHTDVVDDSVTFWAHGSDTEALERALEEVWRRREELPTMGSIAARTSTRFTWKAAATRLDQALRTGMARHGVAALAEPIARR